MPNWKMGDNDRRRTDKNLENIYARLLLIEQYILEGKDQRSQINDTLTILNLRSTNLEYMVHGKQESDNKIERDGINRRVEHLEGKDEESDKFKGGFFKVAVGAITLAVGSFVLWLSKLIWNSVGK